MAKKTRFFLLIVSIALFLVACTPNITMPTTKPLQESTPSPVQVTTVTSSTHLPSVIPSLIPAHTFTPTAPLSPTPLATDREQPGDLYETVFNLTVDDKSIIKYQELPGTILGPIAIAILPDDSFLIADLAGNRLLHYDQVGSLLNTIDLASLGIVYVADMRTRENNLVLLEITYSGRKRIHHLSLDGTLISSYEIPNPWPLKEGTPEIGEPLTLENSLTGVAIDCDGKILLEVEGGASIYSLADVQNNPNPFHISNGYPCNGKLYSVLNAQKPFSRIKAGDAIYETRLTTGFGGLTLLDVFPDGSFYINRNDVVNDRVIQVDQTVHYVGANGEIQGVARIPLTKFYYSIRRNVAINAEGDAFVLFPQPGSLEIIRLNFYPELEPLIPDATIPQITISPNSP